MCIRDRVYIPPTKIVRKYTCSDVDSLVDLPAFVKMDDKEKRVLPDIETISNNIRKIYRALKYGIQEEEEELTRSYKPILEPLKTISQALVEKKSNTTEKPMATITESKKKNNNNDNRNVETVRKTIAMELHRPVRSNFARRVWS